MQVLDPYKIPLNSINLIEASAGTGKSWTVTFLYLRLILEFEPELTVDQILVVTFTDAATKELRDDIRMRLVDALQAFENPDDDDIKDEYRELISSCIDREEAIRRIKRAKLSIDEASIFTIHGFCQRALSDNAFEAGLPFESELQEDDSELMQKLTDDYWRRRFEKAPPALLFKLKQKSITPDSLLKDIKGFVGKPYLEIFGPEKNVVTTDHWEKLEELFQQTLKIWNENSDEIWSLLNNPELNKDGYQAYFKNARDDCFKEMNDLAASGQMPIKIDKASYNSGHTSKLFWLGTKEKTKAKFETIEHPFFEKWQAFLDIWTQMDKSSDDFINQIRIDLLKYLQEELPKEKQRLGVLSFDDLLLQLERTLNEKPELAGVLRDKYRVALIDEFQDTDPIQYNIFRKIYVDRSDGIKNCALAKKNALFLVGDPKQAIYSFRGGDIYTYLKAKHDSSEKNHHTLKTNWRSHADLIAAFNALYGQSDNPFQDQSIEYVEVDAGGSINAAFESPDQRSPLRFWRYEQEVDEAGKSKQNTDQIRQSIAVSVTEDIAELLNAGNQGQAMIGDMPITGGDIAILVRSHPQGALMKQALLERGVSSVQSSRESVFETPEAYEMQYLLVAIIEPQREDNVRRALVTDLMGLRAEDLLAFESDSNAWENHLSRMHDYQHHWKNHGFLPMMRKLMMDNHVQKRLLAHDDGERRLTNVLHLCELIHRESRHQLLGMEEILRWLKQQQDHATTDSKARELRLESDENLVKIVTIHKSKGLEYPIVYCPFVGMSSKATIDKQFTFNHDGNSRLEMGSSDVEQHKAIKIEEEKAEDTRLLYVALTRAKYHCTVVCIPEPISRSPDKTALGWLLTNGKKIQSGGSNKAKENNLDFFASYNENLKYLARNDNISLQDMPVFKATLRYQKPEYKQDFDAKEFSGEIKTQAQITSFSGLTSGLHDERPDYDKSFTFSSLNESSNQNKPQENEFPRGATAGSALHEIYENLDFTLPIEQQQDIVSTALKKWGFDEQHGSAASDLIQNSLQAEIYAGLSLDKLPKHKRLNEMEFYLPLQRLQVDDLKQILFQYLPKEEQSDYNWQVVRDAVQNLNFEQVEGYLKGFIDLVFEHEGKYYVVDYKSNSLPDYTAASMYQAMAEAHYYLQYLLYSVALHRYLKKRIHDYSWESHIGGAYYLFIRGMVSSSETEANENGVFFDKPSLELIEALDDLFAESLL